MQTKHKISEQVLNIALNQYSVQCSRLGNMQSSAGVLFTFVSLIEAILIAVVSQNKDNLAFLDNSCAALVFYISFFASFIFMILACVFMLLVLRPKKITGISNPIELQDELDKVVDESPDLDGDSQTKLINDLLIAKIDDEIEKMDGILEKNNLNYTKCMLASIFSFVGSFVSLFFICGDIFRNINIRIIISFILGGLVFVGVFLLIFFPKGGIKR